MRTLRGVERGLPRQPAPAGWRRLLVRIIRDVDSENIPIFAGGVAFFALLSLTPLLIAVVSIYGLVSDPATVEVQMNRLAEILPYEVRVLVAEQLDEIVRLSPGQLGLGAAASIIGAFWVASKGMFYLFRALNVAYGETETRGFVKVKVTAFAFTVFFIIAAVVAIGAVAALPVVLGLLGLGRQAETLIEIGRWPALAAVVMLALAVLYRFGPDRKAPRWQWLTIGSVTAALGWLVLSYLFALYVASFGKFNETYGSLGTFVVLMLWLYLSATLVLLGAVINADVEQQARAGDVGQRVLSARSHGALRAPHGARNTLLDGVAATILLVVLLSRRRGGG